MILFYYMRDRYFFYLQFSSLFQNSLRKIYSFHIRNEQRMLFVYTGYKLAKCWIELLLFFWVSELLFQTWFQIEQLLLLQKNQHEDMLGAASPKYNKRIPLLNLKKLQPTWKFWREKEASKHLKRTKEMRDRCWSGIKFEPSLDWIFIFESLPTTRPRRA